MLLKSSDITARLEDLNVIFDLETDVLRMRRLSVKNWITLCTLREIYPGSSRRIRDEIIQGSDREEIIVFCMNFEDMDLVETARSSSDTIKVRDRVRSSARAW